MPLVQHPAAPTKQELIMKTPRHLTLERYKLEAAQLGMEYLRPGAKPQTGHFKLPCGHTQDIYHQVVRDMRRIRCVSCPAQAIPRPVKFAGPIEPLPEGVTTTRHKIARDIAVTHGLTYIQECEEGRSYAFFARVACGCTFRHHTNETRLTTAGRRCPVCKDKSLSKEEYEASKASPPQQQHPVPTRAELHANFLKLAQTMQDAVEGIYAELDALKASD